MDNFYDFGGAEFPYNEFATVVDCQPRLDWVDPYKDHIVHDLREPFDHFEPKPAAYVGRCLRYLGGGSYMNESEMQKGADPSKQAWFAEQLDKIITGQIILFDHAEHVDYTISRLIELGWNLNSIELINIADIDGEYPAEWRYILSRG